MGKGTIRGGPRIRPSGADRPPRRHRTQGAGRQRPRHNGLTTSRKTMEAVQWERERFCQKRGQPPKSRPFKSPSTSCLSLEAPTQGKVSGSTGTRTLQCPPGVRSCRSWRRPGIPRHVGSAVAALHLDRRHVAIHDPRPATCSCIVQGRTPEMLRSLLDSDAALTSPEKCRTLSARRRAARWERTLLPLRSAPALQRRQDRALPNRGSSGMRWGYAVARALQPDRWVTHDVQECVNLGTCRINEPGNLLVQDMCNASQGQPRLPKRVQEPQRAMEMREPPLVASASTGRSALGASCAKLPPPTNRL